MRQPRLKAKKKKDTSLPFSPALSLSAGALSPRLFALAPEVLRCAAWNLFMIVLAYRGFQMLMPGSVD